MLKKYWTNIYLFTLRRWWFVGKGFCVYCRIGSKWMKFELMGAKKKNNKWDFWGASQIKKVYLTWICLFGMHPLAFIAYFVSFIFNIYLLKWMAQTYLQVGYFYTNSSSEADTNSNAVKIKVRQLINDTPKFKSTDKTKPNSLSTIRTEIIINSYGPSLSRFIFSHWNILCFVDVCPFINIKHKLLLFPMLAANSREHFRKANGISPAINNNFYGKQRPDGDNVFFPHADDIKRTGKIYLSVLDGLFS